MSWLKRLSRAYSSHRYRSRRVTLTESPDCEVNFDSLGSDTLILNFEQLIDDSMGRPLREKCDIVAIYGSDANCHILLVEVKAGQRRRVQSTKKAADQLMNSKHLIETAMTGCKIEVPNTPTWEAVIVVGRSSQREITRDKMSAIMRRFRVQSGIPLRLVRCGDDVMAGVNGG